MDRRRGLYFVHVDRPLALQLAKFSDTLIEHQ